jgi:hypothetical protein
MSLSFVDATLDALHASHRSDCREALNQVFRIENSSTLKRTSVALGFHTKLAFRVKSVGGSLNILVVSSGGRE